MKRIIIVGASGHGKVVADLAEKNGYEDIVFLDSDKNKKQCGKYPVAGNEDELGRIEGDVVIAIGNAKIREKIQSRIEKERLATLIHPSAIIADDAKIGKGTVVMAGSVINPNAFIGADCPKTRA